MWILGAFGQWLLRAAILNPIAWGLLAGGIYYAHANDQALRRMGVICALATGHVPDSGTNDKIDTACNPGTSPSG